jgi:hypothetical protein
MAYAEPVVEHHHIDSTDSSSGAFMFLIGIIIFAVLAFLFIVFGLPYLRSSIGMGTPTINVPDKVNVDVNKSQ